MSALFESSTKTAYVIARDVDYAGTTLFFGAVAFVAVLWPAGARVPATRRLLGIGWLAGLAGTVAAIGLDGAWSAGRRRCPGGSAPWPSAWARSASSA